MPAIKLQSDFLSRFFALIYSFRSMSFIFIFSLRASNIRNLNDSKWCLQKNSPIEMSRVDILQLSLTPVRIILRAFIKISLWNINNTTNNEIKNPARLNSLRNPFSVSIVSASVHSFLRNLHDKRANRVDVIERDLNNRHTSDLIWCGVVYSVWCACVQAIWAC